MPYSDPVVARAFDKRFRKTYRWALAMRAAAWARQQAVKRGRSPGDVHWSVFARLHALPCVYCGKAPSGGTDHRWPLSRGGDNEVANLVASCRPCNESKGSRTVDEWAEAMRAYPCLHCGKAIIPIPGTFRPTYCGVECGHKRPVSDAQREALRTNGGRRCVA